MKSDLKVIKQELIKNIENLIMRIELLEALYNARQDRIKYLEDELKNLKNIQNVRPKLPN